MIRRREFRGGIAWRPIKIVILLIAGAVTVLSTWADGGPDAATLVGVLCVVVAGLWLLAVWAFG